MSIANAVTWISDSLVSPPSSDGSAVKNNVRMATSEFGDGYIQRTPIGINNISQDYTLVYRYLNYTQHTAMYNFVFPLLASGQTVYVPNYFKNPDGSYKEYFYVASAEPSSSDSLFDWTISLKQVFA